MLYQGFIYIYSQILTVLAIMTMLAERTQTQIATARKRHTSRSILTRIVVAHRNLAQGAHKSGRTPATPSILLLGTAANMEVIVFVVVAERGSGCGVGCTIRLELNANGSVSTGIGQTGE